MELPTDRHITYQIQRRTCGKQKQHHCRACEQGIGHGPYLYAYWRDASGRMHSAYIGKERPAETAPPVAMTASETEEVAVG